MNSLFRVPTALLAGLLLAGLGAGPLRAQDDASGLSADLVREALNGPGDGEAWTALESEAMAAADGPFVLRDLRVDADGLLLELGGYGLPTLEQAMKAGAPTRVVVTLPGARSAVPHGYELPEVRGFESVQVRQAPFGVQVEAVLPAGTAAVLDESAEGVRIRTLTLEAAGSAASPPAVSGAPSIVIWAARTWLEGLRSGRPLALFPLAAVTALTLLILNWIWGRRRADVGAWAGVSDARRLADHLAPSLEPRGER